MPSSEGFVQGYNAQAAVDVESHWVVENHLSQKLAQKIPEASLQEDEQLLMWYDHALTREDNL